MTSVTTNTVTVKDVIVVAKDAIKLIFTAGSTVVSLGADLLAASNNILSDIKDSIKGLTGELEYIIQTVINTIKALYKGTKAFGNAMIEDIKSSIADPSLSGSAEEVGIRAYQKVKGLIL